MTPSAVVSRRGAERLKTGHPWIFRSDIVEAAADRLSREGGVGIRMEMVSSYPAQAFDAGCADAVRRAADTLGYSNMPVVSGAGHDAVYMARLAPTGMIFIPCKDGISHNEIEDARPEHIEAGCNVLFHAMLERAGRSPGNLPR